MATVKIGCRLPHGLTLELGSPVPEADGSPSKTYKAIQLAGLSSARRGAKYAQTTVDADDWAAWVAAHNTLRYVLDASVFIIDGTKLLHPLTLKPLPKVK